MPSMSRATLLLGLAGSLYCMPNPVLTKTKTPAIKTPGFTLFRTTPFPNFNISTTVRNTLALTQVI